MVRRHAQKAGFFVAAALLGATGAARADSSETPAARADRLFHEGKLALEAGHYEEACPRLAESQQLDPGTGTLLALGLCHEGEGKTASAWRELREVVDASQRSGRADRASLAKKHLSALEPRLSKLTVTVRGAEVVVHRDGEALPPASWGQAVPVDPGDHVVDAAIPGAPPWKTTVHVGPDGDNQVVNVPKLGATAAAPPPPPVATSNAPAEAPPAKADRTLAWIVGGAGVALFGIGTYFGIRALGNRSDATSLCPSSPCTNPQGVSENDTAKTQAWVADFGVGLGLVGIAAGVYLLLRPEEPAQAPAAHVVPLAGPGMAGLGLTSAW